ncbi:MAG: hypothetical protein RSB05_00760 [Clostridiales bacterium]
MTKNKNKKKSTMKHFLIVFFGTFFLGVAISLLTTATVENVKTVAVAFVVLMIVISIGVLFDGVGVAVAVADAAPFNARAARKAPGAKKTLSLIKKANVVANVCCDVVGDICGIVSGAIATTIALLVILHIDFNVILASSILAGFTSALTVGGKAMMKTVAIKEANKIMEIVGIILDYRGWSQLLQRKKEKAED